ncbi:SFT2 domain protein [Myriangium duriaei CBS 260.36]|uniref:Protein transport protein SFT2 n=1 Tax=Myriangium duriaei CBS 260.36 TaxID=1168546 RepID=A0A9P4MHB6_9PEZI|nr:SFT2 domain protein [Myriangium duriaei CBS 260.36]
MASANFRDSINSLGWSRRDTSGGANSSATTNNSTPLLGKLQSLNPFGKGGTVRLPIYENEGPGAPLPARTRREEEEGWFALSRWDRLLVFGALNLAALALFIICFFLFPALTLRPRKFAILWSVASGLFLSSWAVMMGPTTYARHLISPERMPFTATYFGSIALTLYFALGLKSTLLTLFSALVQLVCLVWYLVSYFPMGSSGLRLAARFGGSRVTAWMTE